MTRLAFLCTQIYRTHHDGGEVLTLEAVNGQLEGPVERSGDSLSNQTVQVNGTTQELQEKQLG